MDRRRLPPPHTHIHIVVLIYSDLPLIQATRHSWHSQLPDQTKSAVGERTKQEKHRERERERDRERERERASERKRLKCMWVGSACVFVTFDDGNSGAVDDG
jgi:hypothetical protein